TTNRSLQKVLGEVIADLRRGSQLSAALSKHPTSFSSIYCRALAVGEQTGSLEVVLKQMADYLEQDAKSAKEIKNALKYPIIIAIVAVVVIAVIVTFVLPAFANLYSLIGAQLPPMTKLLISMTEWLNKNGLFLFLAIFIIGFLFYIYTRTPAGKLQWDKISLRLPMMGQIKQLDELANCCRSMSMLFRSGLPMPEILSLVIESSQNKVVKGVLAEVKTDMLKGEGLSKPMAKNKLFLPLMVQMIKVGEETGNLDVTLSAVAQAYETEARDKMRALIGIIQPAITLVIGVVVAFIALSLVSAMYSIYGQVT
ncbi:MAG: type II secretion system F family protein, partial [Chloroflexi bacterium]|nr:type II secretion system F family protein [Chloroflexota bacterium]